MPDDKSKIGGQDRARINLSEEYEVQDWMRSLSVSRERLEAAVRAVGDRAPDVRQYLNRT